MKPCVSSIRKICSLSFALLVQHSTNHAFKTEPDRSHSWLNGTWQQTRNLKKRQLNNSSNPLIWWERLWIMIIIKWSQFQHSVHAERQICAEKHGANCGNYIYSTQFLKLGGMFIFQQDNDLKHPQRKNSECPDLNLAQNLLGVIWEVFFVYLILHRNKFVKGTHLNSFCCFLWWKGSLCVHNSEAQVSISVHLFRHKAASKSFMKCSCCLNKSWETMIINNPIWASHANADMSKFKVKTHTMPWQLPFCFARASKV